MDRRTFLGLLAGSVLFPGVPEFQIPDDDHEEYDFYLEHLLAHDDACWEDITPTDYAGQMWRCRKTGALRAMSVRML